MESLDNNGTLTSLNHRTWPLVSEWFYSVLAGINIGDPASAHIETDPDVVGDLNWTETSIETVRSEVASQWERTDAGLRLDRTISWNATARVAVPDLGANSVRLVEGGSVIWSDGQAGESLPAGVENVDRIDGSVPLEVGNGEYSFALEADKGDSQPNLGVEEALKVSGSRTDDGQALTGLTNRINLSVEANRGVTVRDALPADWEVVGGDLQEVCKEDGTHYVEFDSTRE